MTFVETVFKYGTTMTRGAKRDACLDAASTATRAVISGGSTLSRYSWLSNSSLDGMLITRALIPSVFNCS